MIQRITIAQAGQHVGETVEIAGWLYNIRRSGKIAFPIVRDGYGLMQCVAVKSALPEELFEAIKNLTQESSIIVTGKIRAEQRAQGGYEMDLESLQVLQRVPESDPYPITPKEHGTDFLMDHRHLWLRSQRQHAIIRVRHEVIKAVRDYFDSHGFTLVDTPIFTPAACEGTTTLFEVDYFDDDDFTAPPDDLRLEAVEHYKVLRAFASPAGRGEPDPADRQLSFQVAQCLPDLDFLHALLQLRSEAGRLKELNQYLAAYIPRRRAVERMQKLAPTNGCGAKPAGL